MNAYTRESDFVSWNLSVSKPCNILGYLWKYIFDFMTFQIQQIQNSNFKMVEDLSLHCKDFHSINFLDLTFLYIQFHQTFSFLDNLFCMFLAIYLNMIILQLLMFPCTILPSHFQKNNHE